MSSIRIFADIGSAQIHLIGEMIKCNDGIVKRKVAIGQLEVVVCCRGQLFDEAAERITQISHSTDKRQAAGQWTRLKLVQNLPERIKWISRSFFNSVPPIKLKVCPFAAKNQEGLRTDERVAPKFRVAESSLYGT